jgi:hypothetical protein
LLTPTSSAARSGQRRRAAGLMPQLFPIVNGGIFLRLLVRAKLK